MTTSNDERKLYHEGDIVTVHHLIYPGARPFTAQGRVIKCVSPTYYEVEYIDHRGKLCVKRFMRSQLP